MDYKTFTIIMAASAILQLIVLICFFVLVSDVSKIKKSLLSEKKFDELIKMAEEEKFIGNFAKYKEYLLRAEYKIKCLIDGLQDNELYNAQYIKQYEKHIEDIEKKLDELNIK